FDCQSSPEQKELWKCRVRGKSGKPKTGFPLFPPPLGNLANPARFPHSHSSGGPRLEKWKTKIRFPTFPHTTRDDDDSFQNIKIKTKPRRLRRPKNKPKKERFTPQNVISVRPTSRLTSHWKRNPLSGSFRVGNKYRFQAHFRIGKCSGSESCRPSVFAGDLGSLATRGMGWASGYSGGSVWVEKSGLRPRAGNESCF